MTTPFSERDYSELEGMPLDGHSYATKVGVIDYNIGITLVDDNGDAFYCLNGPEAPISKQKGHYNDPVKLKQYNTYFFSVVSFARRGKFSQRADLALDEVFDVDNITNVSDLPMHFGVLRNLNSFCSFR